MLNSVFYHQLIRKYISIFGNMFNDIYISRQDNLTGTEKTSLVPIHYGPQEKWIALFEKPLSERKIAISLPLLSFQMSSIMFDFSRNTSPLNKIVNKNEITKTSRSAYNLVPYKIGFDLFILAKYSDDAAQIFEQIAPYFAPAFTNNTNLIPELDLKMDIVTRLVSIGMEDIYEGDFQSRRQIVWTLSFEMDVFFIGPVVSGGVIKRIEIDLVPTEKTNKITAVHDHLVEMPGLTVDGLPTTKEELSIPYKNIKSTDNYGFIEEWSTIDEQ